jgi:hypothetical protein
VILIAPAESRELEQGFRLLHLLREIETLRPAARESTVADQMAYTLGMAGCILDGDRTALADPQQRKPLEASGVDRAFEIAHPALERDVGHPPVRRGLRAGLRP